MPTLSTSGSDSELLKRDDSLEPNQTLIVNGKLDPEAYFRFLDEYWRLFTKKKPREPIVIKNCKL